jgi:non-canonical (house-cleaning) NTP pyrophosphatase
MKPELAPRNTPISFYICSTSRIKIDAITQARNEKNIHATVSPVHGASSNINEQPLGEQEILKGAINRAINAYYNDPRGEVYFAIENGIERQKDEYESYINKYLDYAIVLALIPITGQMCWVRSEAVEFPYDYVLKTHQKPGGFLINTVGQTLKEEGLVKFKDDPHLDLVGKSRREILKDSLLELFNYLPHWIWLSK